jgi:hypothetical protein
MVRKIYDGEGQRGYPLPKSGNDNAHVQKKYEEFLREIGTEPGSALVNCCRITVKVDIKIRSADGEKTPGYHQIKVVTKGEVRSYVSGTYRWGRYITLSGTWEDDPGNDPRQTYWPAEAHEVGHIMGLPDSYSDNWVGKGSTPHEGHESDLMGHGPFGWPQSKAFTEILALYGFACDCCEDAKRVVERVTTAIVNANRMIRDCDVDGMKQARRDLVDQRSALAGVRIPLPLKYELFNTINQTLANIFITEDKCAPMLLPSTYESTYMTVQLEMEYAIRACDRERIQQIILRLQSEPVTIAKEIHAVTVRQKLTQVIDGMKDKLEKALRDCPPTETITIGHDPLIWCTYGPGSGYWIQLTPANNKGDAIAPVGGPKIDIGQPPGPITPSGTPTTPGGTPTTPGDTPTAGGIPTTPGGTPATPGGTPAGGIPTTPGGTPTTPGGTPSPGGAPPTQSGTPTGGGNPETPKTLNTPEAPKRGETPPPAQIPGTPVTTTLTLIPYRIFVKARQAVLEKTQTGNPIEGQVIKLLPSTRQALPNTGETKTAQDIGFDQPAPQCTTGPDGSCSVQVQDEDGQSYKLPASEPNKNYRVDVDLPKNGGGVVETTGQPGTPVIPALPAGVNVTTTAIVTGDRSFTRFAFTQPYSSPVDATPLFTPAFPGLREDFCRDKQPGPPLGWQPLSLSSLGRELPESTLKLKALLGRSR